MYNGRPLSTNANLVYRFNKAGTYTIRAKQNMRAVTVDSLTFNIQEYWVIAETGQVIYKRTSNGKLGDVESAEGRNADVNTAYYHMVSKQSPTNNQTPGASGTVVKEFRHVVTEEMLKNQFPSAGFNIDYGTVRVG